VEIIAWIALDYHLTCKVVPDYLYQNTENELHFILASG
jgi:hypothetical protein